MTAFTRFSVTFFVCVLPALVGAQVFRCADGAGKLQYSDKPCAAGQQASEVRIYKQPDAPAPVQRMSPEATAYEQKRQERRESSNASHQRVDEAAAKVYQIRADNQDPRKCAAAREGMTRLAQRDPIMHKYGHDYFWFSQQASLHCGN